MKRNKVKTLVIGGRGFLGRNFLEAYKKADPTIKSTQHVCSSEPFYLNLEKPDISQIPLDLDYTHALIAASTGLFIDCERFQDRTYIGNVSGTLSLAKQLSKLNITPILFSSSYVFDGSTGGYLENSPLNPINHYGCQKAELERTLPTVCGENYLLLRLSKVFTLNRKDGTLLDEIVSKLVSGDPIQAAFDQVFTPILLDDLIRITFHLQSHQLTGLYNICGVEAWSRYNLAIALADSLSKSCDQIKAISLDDLPDKIKRPKKNDMICQKVLETGVAPPKTITECIKNIENLWVEHV